MAAEVMEEELLRSIEEVEARIVLFRNKVRAVLSSAQTEMPNGARKGSEDGN
ncbi:MAG: hypothetical protein VX911_00375 [Candidatus Latescibacterota bacterium]|jgi:hypothetical protein|nr:hypothetical protein [Candidatus Latescibacterota bacterium]|tara:strand:+ start:70 stop:225 length:156 start_codon:yes stop_codon:yes gene_type:complete